MQHYWLVKSEPDEYSIDDLQRNGTTFWSGVRNYQARNTMRDAMKNGDGVLFYHSNTDETGIVGIAEVCREGYPDFTALDPDNPYYDPKATPEKPIWMMVDIRFIRKLPERIPLDRLRNTPGLEKMTLLQRGSRLSVQPVTVDEWEIVMGMV